MMRVIIDDLVDECHIAKLLLLICRFTNIFVFNYLDSLDQGYHLLLIYLIWYSFLKGIRLTELFVLEFGREQLLTYYFLIMPYFSSGAYPHRSTINNNKKYLYRCTSSYLLCTIGLVSIYNIAFFSRQQRNIILHSCILNCVHI